MRGYGGVRLAGHVMGGEPGGTHSQSRAQQPQAQFGADAVTARSERLDRLTLQRRAVRAAGRVSVVSRSGHVLLDRGYPEGAR